MLQRSLRGLRPMRCLFSGTCPLAGSRLLGGRGHKECSGSALALSLPRDRDKEGVARSRTLGACNLSRCHHRFQGRQIFPALVWVGCFLLVAGSFLLLHLPTRSAWQVLFGSWLRWRDLFLPVVFACALCSGTC